MQQLYSNVRVMRTGRIVYVHLAGEFDAPDAARLERDLAYVDREFAPEAVMLNLREVDYLSNHALDVLARRARTLHERGAAMLITVCSSSAALAIRVNGLDIQLGLDTEIPTLIAGIGSARI